FLFSFSLLLIALLFFPSRRSSDLAPVDTYFFSHLFIAHFILHFTNIHPISHCIGYGINLESARPVDTEESENRQKNGRHYCFSFIFGFFGNKRNIPCNEGSHPSG